MLGRMRAGSARKLERSRGWLRADGYPEFTQVEVTAKKKMEKVISPARGKAGKRKDETTGPHAEDAPRLPSSMHTANDDEELVNADAENKKLIRVNPENLGDVIQRKPMSEAGRVEALER
jgi:hypothetical protein